MDGEIAQAIALVSYGNTFLKTSGQTVPELLDSNSTFKWVGSVTFARLHHAQDTKDELIEVARRTSAWFDDLRLNRAIRLWLYVLRGRGFAGIPEIVAVSFAGGGRWQIQVDYDDHFEIWVPSWTHRHMEPKIWAVEYKGLRLRRPAVSSYENLDRARRKLVGAIQGASNLARKAEARSAKRGDLVPGDPLAYYAEVFREAVTDADSTNPVPAYHPDMLSPLGYSLKARQVIAAASKAWVFGGMSSWNDLDWKFRGAFLRIRYGMITRRLYDAVIRSLVAATNSFGG